MKPYHKNKKLTLIKKTHKKTFNKIFIKRRFVKIKKLIGYNNSIVSQKSSLNLEHVLGWVQSPK